MTDIINPFEDYPIPASGTWAALKAAGTGEGENFLTPKTYTAVAAADGHAVYNGGEFHEIIIHLADGRGIRYSEGATPLGPFPRDVKMFDPIVANANLRGGEYRSPHMNGIDIHGNRIQFTAMVTETQAQARAKLIPLPANQRKVSTNYSRIRNNKTTDGGIVIEVNNGTILTVDGFVNNGSEVANNPYWYHVISPAKGFISATLIQGGMITDGLTDMSEIATTPLISDLTPPVTTPVVTPPVTVTTPPVTVANPPAPASGNNEGSSTVTNTGNTQTNSSPIIDINSANAADIGTDLADVAQVSFTPAGRKKLYNVVTTLSAVLTPVYALALASAAFIGGQVRDDILIGTGITLIVDKVINGFTTRLASKNVGI